MKNNSVKKGFLSNGSWFILFFISYILFCILNVNFSKLMGNAFDIAATGDMGQFIDLAYKLVFVLIGTIFGFLVYNVFENKYMQGVYISVRKNIFKNLFNKPIPDFMKKEHSSYISDLINDVNVIDEQYIKPSVNMLEQVIILLIALVALLQMNVWATVFIVLASFLPLIIANAFTPKIQAKMVSYSTSMQKYTMKTNEFYNGYEVFRNYNKEYKAINIHNQFNEDLAQEKYKSFKVLDIVTNYVVISSIFITIGVLVVGMFLAINGYLSIGEVFAISFISGSISGPIGSISNEFPKIRGVKSLVDKYNVQISDKSNQQTQINTLSTIKLQNVSISFDEPVLNNVSVEFLPNKKYAIIGASGSGKSTIIKTVLGFYDTYEGNVLIDNASLKNIEINSLYNMFTYVAQSTFFFQGTIRDNITLFDDNISDADILNALEIAEIKDKVLSLKDGLLTYMNENVTNFSGGEKQRLSIARALLKKTKYYFMDEATSALDLAHYKMVEKNLLNIKDSTIITVTHRLDKEILSLYDTILVIDKGVIVENGSLEQLLLLDGYFNKLYTSQE